MKKRTFNLISILISLVFAAAIIYFLAGIIQSRLNGPERSQEIFSLLTEKTTQAADKYPLDSYSFSEEFIRSAGDSSNYSRLSLSVDGRLIYSYPNQFTKPSKQTNFHKAEFQTKNGQTLSIEAEIFNFPPSSILNYARTAFIIIFIATIISILILIFAKPEAEDDKADDFLNIEEIEDTAETDFSEAEETSTVTKTEDSPKEEDFSEPEETEEIWESPDLKDEAETWEPPELREEKISEETTAAESTEPTEEKNKIRPEFELDGSLQKALDNADTTGEDLALIVVKADGKSGSFSAAAEECFYENCRDGISIFEHGDGGFVLLLTGTNLDDALLPAKNIYDSLSGKLTAAKITVGLSSRNNRKISSGRLLMEAVEAQKHAAEDPDSPVIAFRASPEKYKELIQ